MEKCKEIHTLRRGDIVVAFSTAHRIPHTIATETLQYSFLREDGKEVSYLFTMTVEVIEEDI